MAKSIPKPAPFVLVLSEYITKISPTASELTCVDNLIEPEQYFITSGDAIQKSKQLLKDYTKQHNLLKSNKTAAKYQKAIQANIKLCHLLIEKLIEVRGTAIFLECEWNEHMLVCLPKNPRAK